MRRTATHGLAIGLVVGLVGVGGASAAAAAVADPVSAHPAPAVVETFTSYLPQVSCDPAVKPGTAALRSLLLSTYGGRDLGVTRSCSIGGLSEHKEGRAFDWGLNVTKPTEKAIAKQFLTWALATGPDGQKGYNARRLGIMYLIWNHRIWGAYRAAEGWRDYTGSEGHTDHIHISLSWNGATKKTSWWTGAVAAVDYGPCVKVEGEMAPKRTAANPNPCPAPTPVMDLTGTPLLGLNSTGPYVRQLQMILKVKPVSGTFLSETQAALEEFQRANGLTVTGKTNATTWKKLRDKTSVFPGRDVTVPGLSAKFTTTMRYKVKRGDTLAGVAARWRSSATAIKAASHLSTRTLHKGQVLTVPVKSGLTKYSHRVLRIGSHGWAVKALQRGLKMPKAVRTGMFGRITRRTLNNFREAHGWKRNGVAGPRVWRALGA